MPTRISREQPVDWYLLQRRDNETRHDSDPAEWIANARLMAAHPFCREACDRQPDPLVIAHYVEINR